ncbi:VQ domain-containing protein [Hirschfeldia incana]|nr:VQ domain-containing protein [Hirschfeldia incana]
MDSGNSSSMQSSSGGGGDQEEYDSRADQSISALFNNNATTVSSNITGQTQLDSLIANCFNTGWSADNPLWSTTTTNPTDGYRPPSQPPISSEPVFFTNTVQENPRVATNTNTSSPIGSVPTDKKTGLATTRNPKKRSRVSRRAPTTVLTTDTSNFRAMVQEFTGNPSTPFTGSSSTTFSRSRFDLFGPSSSSFSRPLKPFPHKLTPSSSTSHHYSTPPPSTDFHQSLLRNMNMQNIANPFLNNQSPSNVPLMDQSLSLRTSTGFGYAGANSEGLHSIIASSSSSLTQPALNVIHGSDKNYEADNDMLRSISGNEQPMVQRSDGYTPLVASGSENNITDVRNEGMVELSWISSSD